jgi:WD40 repeat protein
VVTASADETARLWDATSGKPLQTLARHRGLVWSASFRPDGCEVITASADGTVRTWNVATGKQQKKWKLSVFQNPKKTKPGSPTRPVIPLCAQPRPQTAGFVTGCGDKAARTWDGEKTTPALELAGHEGAVLSARYDRDGKRIVTASRDGIARVFDAATGTCMQTFQCSDGPLRCAAFSRDGKLIATAACNGKLRIWDSASGQVIKTWDGHSSSIWSVDFSPDGKLLSASLDGTARLWGFGDPGLPAPPGPECLGTRCPSEATRGPGGCR